MATKILVACFVGSECFGRVCFGADRPGHRHQTFGLILVPTYCYDGRFRDAAAGKPRIQISMPAVSFSHSVTWHSHGLWEGLGLGAVQVEALWSLRNGLVPYAMYCDCWQSVLSDMIGPYRQRRSRLVTFVDPERLDATRQQLGLMASQVMLWNKWFQCRGKLCSQWSVCWAWV